MRASAVGGELPCQLWLVEARYTSGAGRCWGAVCRGVWGSEGQVWPGGGNRCVVAGGKPCASPVFFPGCSWAPSFELGWVRNCGFFWPSESALYQRNAQPLLQGIALQGRGGDLQID